MSSYVVFIDHEHAKIFKMLPGQVEKLNLHKHIHFTHHSNQPEKKKDSSHLFHEVISGISDATEILVVGHGTAKDQLVHHLQSDHKNLAKKIVGVETVDKPTDNQILALARKFFKSHHLFA